MTRCALLAAFFTDHPNVWVDGTRLEFAGRYAWRSRVSDLRFPPYLMVIENRVRRLSSGVKVSEYRYVPKAAPAQAELFSELGGRA